MTTPAISVGNLAMGGRGKSPLVALIAALLRDAGERPAIVSRGYRRRRRLDGVTVVSDGASVLADLDTAGDEPLMLARAVPEALVLVCEQRATAAALATHALGASIIVLDDGFQHRVMARDVDIVVVAPRDLDDRRMPFGRLREPVSALAGADALIVDGDADAVAGRLARFPARVFTLRRRAGVVTGLAGGAAPPDPAAPVFAVAGIAEPERFAALLRSAGWSIAGTMWFRDHHAYDGRDLTRIAAAMRAAGATAVVTTAKDVVRMAPLAPFPIPVAVVPLIVEVEPAAEFRAWLLDRIARARRGAA